MGLQTEVLNYGSGGMYGGYMARMAGQNRLPAVIVIQEIWGVDEHIQDVTRRFAQAGYAAFAPDLYARNGKRREELSDERIKEAKAFMEGLPNGVWSDQEKREAAIRLLPEQQQERIVQTFQAMFGGAQAPEYIEQLKAAADFLDQGYETTEGKGIASVGFCLGGALSAQLACSIPHLKAAVIYYGRSPKAEDIKTIECPMLGFYGELDPGISSGVPEFASQLEAAGKSFDYRIYKGAGHAFFNDTRSSYHCDAARDSFSRTLVFFNSVLGLQTEEG